MRSIEKCFAAASIILVLLACFFPLAGCGSSNGSTNGSNSTGTNSNNAGNNSGTNNNGNNAASCLITPTAGSDGGISPGQTNFVVLWNASPGATAPATIESAALTGPIAFVNGSGGPWPECPNTPFTLNVNQACNYYVQYNGTGSSVGNLVFNTNCAGEQQVPWSFAGQ